MPRNTKRPHSKVRTGCIRCKQRRIKCDEQKPGCGNCTKYSVRCDYTQRQRDEIPSVASPASQSAPGDLSMDNARDSSHDSPMGSPREPVQTIPTSGPPSTLAMPDLVLLHNYCTSTCATLSYDPMLKSLWRVNVPQLGFEHDFVMHAILALSAMQLARFIPHKRDYYAMQGMSHHHCALTMVTSILPNITQDNAAALYIFAAITCFFTLAGPRKSDDFLLVGNAGIADWLYHLRGTKSIMSIAGPSLFNGVLGPIISAGSRRAALQQSRFAGEEYLGELWVLIDGAAIDGHDRHTYHETIDRLHDSYSVIYGSARISQAGGGYEIADIMSWPYRVSDDYLSLLRQRSQEALAIFAFFSVLIKRLESYWFMEGWGVHLISQIHRLLDEEHRLWIRWPIEEIGWVAAA